MMLNTAQGQIQTQLQVNIHPESRAFNVSFSHAEGGFTGAGAFRRPLKLVQDSPSAEPCLLRQGEWQR